MLSRLSSVTFGLSSLVHFLLLTFIYLSTACFVILIVKSAFQDTEEITLSEDGVHETDGCSVGRGMSVPAAATMSPADSACCSPNHVVFHSASQSPTHTASDFEDARSDLPEQTPSAVVVSTEEDRLLGAMPPPPPPPPPPPMAPGKSHIYSEENLNEIRRAPPADNTAGGSGLKRRFSRGSVAQSRSHSRSHSRRVSDFSDIELPPLEALFGHHLHFHPEEDGMTPDENDLFPSTPLDEDQLQNADNRLKEQLGDVVINKIEEVCACRRLYIVRY